MGRQLTEADPVHLRFLVGSLSFSSGLRSTPGALKPPALDSGMSPLNYHSRFQPTQCLLWDTEALGYICYLTLKLTSERFGVLNHLVSVLFVNA